jgi:hypothetical protein
MIDDDMVTADGFPRCVADESVEARAVAQTALDVAQLAEARGHCILGMVVRPQRPQGNEQSLFVSVGVSPTLAARHPAQLRGVGATVVAARFLRAAMEEAPALGVSMREIVERVLSLANNTGLVDEAKQEDA